MSLTKKFKLIKYFQEIHLQIILYDMEYKLGFLFCIQNDSKFQPHHTRLQHIKMHKGNEFKY